MSEMHTPVTFFIAKLTPCFSFRSHVKQALSNALCFLQSSGSINVLPSEMVIDDIYLGDVSK